MLDLNLEQSEESEVDNLGWTGRGAFETEKSVRFPPFGKISKTRLEVTQKSNQDSNPI